MKKKIVKLPATVERAFESGYAKYTHYLECLHSTPNNWTLKHLAAKTPICLTAIHGTATCDDGPKLSLGK